MSDSVPQNIPPAWYPDPAGGPQQRWWDGTQWTEHYQQPYTAAVNYAALKAPEGIPVYNVWIWLVTLLPALSILLSLFTTDLSGYGAIDLNDPYAANRAQMEMMTSPAYVLSSVAGWVIYGLGVFFAYRDWRTLTLLQVPRPFHWAWAFLGVVYPIGRSVVVRRRTGHGIAPMWVSIGILALSLILGIVLFITLMSTMMSSISDQIGR